MGLLKSRKNKKFNYKPRYYDDKGEGNPYKMKHKFDSFRTTIGNNNGLKNKFIKAVNDLKSNPNQEANKRTLIIVFVLLLIFLFIIEFDLSIFISK
jgi:hypothetical protein